MNKVEAIRKFVRSNYKLLNERSLFDKIGYKAIKREYFGKTLQYKFGSPNDKEICNIFCETLIKNKKIHDKETLDQEIENVPFLRINNIKSDGFLALIFTVSEEYALKDEVDKLQGIEKIEKQLEWVKKEHSKEIESLISQKEEEYRRLPSILEDKDFKEPEYIAKRDRTSYWWEDLNLKENPFPGPLDGLYMIDKSLYQSIIVETAPILWALDKLESPSLDIFHRGYLLAGEFGTGKTTFYDFISSHLTVKLIEPIRIALTENITEAHYVNKFEHEICKAVSDLCKQHHLQATSPIIDFSEAINHMLDLQSLIKGFLIFIDDLHKHTNLDLVFRFISHLQIVKNNFSRAGVNVAFIVAEFPSWRNKIKQDSALTGFLDAADELTLPEVTPDLAAQAIKKRLQAFSINPNKELDVKEEFLKSIFKRVSKERGLANIGFRPYIQEAVQRLQQKQFDILSVDITLLDPQIAKEIKSILEDNNEFTICMNKLIFGGGIKKKKIRERALRILCETYLRKGVSENEEFFRNNMFYFKKLCDAGLIHKFRREIEGDSILIWNVNRLINELNDVIISKYHLSIEDYLVPIYLSITPRKQPKEKRNRVQIFEQDLKRWKKVLEPSYINNIQDALNGYSEHIFRYVHERQHRHFSQDNLPSRDDVKNPVWIIMKSIIQYESPQLLSICGENNIRGWLLRHRSLQCPEHFILLLHDVESTSVSVSNYLRLISFADESFSELWNEFNESMRVQRYSGVRCYQLPQAFINAIYTEYSTLLTQSNEHLDYFQSLDRFMVQIEHAIRTYLHVSSTLIFGPMHRRTKYYPEEITRYITKNLPSSSTSYESYNEFENLNRGQYRYIFQDLNKSLPFYRYIIRPVIQKWDKQDFDAFFSIFGDLNIITSHNKTIAAEDTRSDMRTFFRLSCRLLSDICTRLKELVFVTNTIEYSDDYTYLLFGYQYFKHENPEKFITSGETNLPEAIYKHDITEALAQNAIESILDCSDNMFGCVEIDLMKIEETRIKFNREFCESVSLVVYSIATDIVLGRALYGASIWLKAQ